MGESGHKVVSGTLPEIKTKRLLLRPLERDDADALFPAFSSDENMRYWSRGPFLSLNEFRRYMEWNVSASEALCFAITEANKPKDALGWIVLVDRGRQCAEIGFILRPDAQGKGFAKEALASMLTYGFEDKTFRRIFADVDPDNGPSIALLEALEFRYEGRLKENYETHIGVRDSLIYARLRSEEMQPR